MKLSQQDYGTSFAVFHVAFTFATQLTVYPATPTAAITAPTTVQLLSSHLAPPKTSLKPTFHHHPSAPHPSPGFSLHSLQRLQILGRSLQLVA